MASKEITTRKTIQELTKSFKKAFVQKTDLEPIQSLAQSAIHSVGFAGNKISFYTTAEASGSAAFSVDLPADMVLVRPTPSWWTTSRGMRARTIPEPRTPTLTVSPFWCWPSRAPGRLSTIAS